MFVRPEMPSIHRDNGASMGGTIYSKKIVTFQGAPKDQVNRTYNNHPQHNQIPLLSSTTVFRRKQNARGHPPNLTMLASLESFEISLKSLALLNARPFSSWCCQRCECR
jgi:hypothetical protein